MSIGLNVKIETEEERVIVRIEGRLDASFSPVLESKLRELIQDGKTQIILDFAKVYYLSSAGIRLLLSITKQLSAKGGHLYFCSINEEVMEIIKMAGFERILKIFKTKKEACDALPPDK